MKRGLVVVAVLALLAGAGYLGWQSWKKKQRAAARSRSGLAFVQLEACLVGAPELSPAEAQQRLRRIALGQGFSAPPGPDAWPRRCAPFAHAMAKDFDRATGGRGQGDIENLARQLEQPDDQLWDWQAISIPSAVATTWHLAQKAELPRIEGRPASPAPPPPAEPAAPRRLETGGFGGNFLAGTGTTSLYGGDQVCVIVPREGRPLAELRCRKLAGLPQRRHLLDPLAPGPLMLDVFGEEASDGKGIYPFASGERQWAAKGKSLVAGFQRADEWAAVVRGSDRKLTLVRRRGGQVSEKPLALAVDPAHTRGVADWLIYADPPGPAAKVHARRVLLGDAPLGPDVVLGPLGSARLLRQHVCRAGDTLVVQLDGLADPLLAFVDGDSWNRARQPPTYIAESQLGCTDQRAIIVHARARDGGIDVTREICSAVECSKDAGHIAAPEVRELDVVGAPLGDKVLVVWRGARGQAWYRFDDPANLERAPTRLAVDDADHADAPVLGFQFVAIARDAVLVSYASSGGAGLLRFDPSGAVRALDP